MAIQFNCPSCGAMIRVPDTAGGKKGTCPRCSEKLLVPDLAAAAGAAAPPAAPQFPAPSGKLELPPLDFQTSSPAPVEPQFPAFGRSPVEVPHFPDAPAAVGLPPLSVESPASITYALKNKSRTRKKQTQGAWIIPAVCALGLIGFMGWYLWKSQPKLEGELAAHTVRNLEVVPGLIPGSASGLPADDLDEVLRHLRAEPAHWTSTASKMTLTGTDQGVEVTIRPGTATHFVSVQPARNPVFLAYVTQHSAELDQPRSASITQHAPLLFADWKTQFAKHEPLTNQKAHRDLVAMPTLVTGIGYHLEAVVNGNLYPCVYEDEEGHVYFLLPNATKSFQLQGRQVAGGPQLPANFHVKISGTVEAPTVPKNEKSQSSEERELENEGMNPDLYKQNLEELREERRNKGKKKKSDSEALKAGLGSALTGDAPDTPVFRSKSATKKPSMMMMDGDEDLMDDEMPAKSKPKSGASKMSPKDEMMEPGDEMMEQPKPPKRVMTP